MNDKVINVAFKGWISSIKWYYYYFIYIIMLEVIFREKKTPTGFFLLMVAEFGYSGIYWQRTISWQSLFITLFFCYFVFNILYKYMIKIMTWYFLYRIAYLPSVAVYTCKPYGSQLIYCDRGLINMGCEIKMPCNIFFIDYVNQVFEMRCSTDGLIYVRKILSHTSWHKKLQVPLFSIK